MLTTIIFLNNILEDFDRFFADIAHQFLSSTGWFFSPIFSVITFLGNIGWFFVLTSIILLLFKKTRKAGCNAIIAMIFGFFITNIILKYSIARPRPYADESSIYYEYWKAAGALVESKYSFPSGHSTVSMAFGFSMFMSFNKKYSRLYLFIPLIMGFTRIYFVVHYASDVFGGFLVGLSCSLMSYYLFKFLLKYEFVNKMINLPSIIDIFKKNKDLEKNN